MSPEDFIKARERSGKESGKRFLIFFLPSLLLIIGYVLFIDFMKFYEKPSLANYAIDSSMVIREFS